MQDKIEFFVDRLRVFCYKDRQEMGREAALKAGGEIISRLKEKEELNIIFASAPSQDDFLAALIRCNEIEWERINAFHMDEYIGLSADAPQGFGNYLRERVFDKVHFRSVNLINGLEPDPQEECERYDRLLKEFPPNMVFMGIGENGHIAFNDPHVADFNDPVRVKVVDLDIVSRKQQVNDGCFKNLNEVPERALSLTIPALLQAERLFCIVPGKTKAQAVLNTIKKQVHPKYPSSILRTHPRAELSLDQDSACLLTKILKL